MEVLFPVYVINHFGRKALLVFDGKVYCLVIPYPPCRIRDLWIDVSRDRSFQRVFLKDFDTSDVADLTVPWSNFSLYVVTNWFI